LRRTGVTDADAADAFEKAIATTVNKAAKDTENTIPQSKKDAA
jgi:hypothetical protein